MRTAIAVPAPAVEAGGIAQIAIVKGLAQLGRGQATDLSQRYGSARVQKAVAAMSVGGNPEANDMGVIVSAFIQQLRNQSAFYALLERMIRVPYRTRISMIATDATAWIVNEGQPIPVTRATIDALNLEPTKAAALLVLTEELLRSTKNEQNISLALRRAIAAAVDARFFGMVIDGDTPTIPSSGATAANAITDLKALVAAVNPKAESVPLLVMSPEVLQGAAFLTDASGAFQFPDLTINGGEIRGMPVMPSDGIGAGRVALIDASGIAGESGDIAIDASTEADLQMIAETVPGAADMVSMWQTNSVAIRAVIDFDAERVRDDAVAVLTGVEWGEAP